MWRYLSGNAAGSCPPQVDRIVPVLAEVEEFAYLSYVRTVYQCYVIEVTLLLLCLLRQDVTVVSVVSLDLSRSGQGETLFSAGIRFYLWHFVLIYVVNR